MQILIMLGILVLSYIIGSIPFGLVIVRLSTGKDIRRVESGRTGGTNAMRAAGLWAGLGTAFMDFMKGAFVVWIARSLSPGNLWLQVLAPVAAIIGHNYSLFLTERDGKGRLRFRGGAGGATTVGGAMGLWMPSILIIIPVGALILFGVGYASVATMSAALVAIVIFAYRALIGVSPWQYIFYGAVAEIILILSLLPNIRRLIQGTERVVGWRARHLKNQNNA
jgi:glycerol-3-phosphate acyltransferase PlsY